MGWYLCPKVVTIGGGTGLSTMLRGLKRYTTDITAIVTVADDGGGSGRLREDLGMLPPGDIRNCILALANTEPIMEKLLQYRFTEGELKGQSFGNLFLAAMNGICSSFEEAVRNMSYVLAVTGKVLPVTVDNVKLCAELKNGMIVEGESRIPQFAIVNKSEINRIYLNPKTPSAFEECIDEIKAADVIVLGPGSLYTSIIPNLIVGGIADAIRESRAVKIYILNIMTQPGETTGYKLSDHINAIEKHAGKGLIDYAIVNKKIIPNEVSAKYSLDGAQPVIINRVSNKKIKVVREDLLLVNDKLAVRHNPDKLADCIMSILSKRYDDCNLYTPSKNYNKMLGKVYKVVQSDLKDKNIKIYGGTLKNAIREK